MRWKDKLIKDLVLLSKFLTDNTFERVMNEKNSLHLAIFSEPFLSLLLAGEKSMESRLSINKLPPFRKVNVGDIVLVKKTGGGIVAIFEIEEVSFFSNLNPDVLENINNRYGKDLCWEYDPDFLSLKSTAKFCTIVKAKNLIRIPELHISKSDRTGWVIIRKGLRNTLFDYDSNK